MAKQKPPEAPDQCSGMTPGSTENPTKRITVPGHKSAGDLSPNVIVEPDNKPHTLDDIDEPNASADTRSIESTGASSGQLIPESKIKVSPDLTLELVY